MENYRIASDYWGVLKYKYPEATCDWNDELVKALDIAMTSDDLNLTLFVYSLNKNLNLEWMNNYNSENIIEPSGEKVVSTNWSDFEKYIFLQEDTLLFIKRLMGRVSVNNMKYLNTGGKMGIEYLDHYEVEATEEFSIKKAMLGFFQVHQLLKYRYPYKQSMTFPLDSCFDILLPKFLQCNSTTEYYILLSFLNNFLNDPHAYCYNIALARHYGKYELPVKLYYKEGKYLIDTIFDTINNRKYKNFQILKINNKSAKYLDSIYFYGYSPSYKLKKVASYIDLMMRTNVQGLNTLQIASSTDTLDLKINSTYLGASYIYYNTVSDRKSKMQINDSTLYLNANKLSKKNFNKIRSQSDGSQIYYFDLRNLDRKNIIDDIIKSIEIDTSKLPIIKYYDPRYPDYIFQNKEEIIYSPSHLKGKAFYFIIDHTIKSRYESLLLYALSNPNVILVGDENTAGAFGSMYFITLPWNLEFYFTGSMYLTYKYDIYQSLGLTPIKKIGSNLY